MAEVGGEVDVRRGQEQGLRPQHDEEINTDFWLGILRKREHETFG